MSILAAKRPFYTPNLKPPGTRRWKTAERPYISCTRLGRATIHNYWEHPGPTCIVHTQIGGWVEKESRNLGSIPLAKPILRPIIRNPGLLTTSTSMGHPSPHLEETDQHHRTGAVGPTGQMWTGG